MSLVVRGGSERRLPGRPFVVHVLAGETVDEQAGQSAEDNVFNQLGIIISGASSEISAGNLFMHCVGFDMFVEIPRDFVAIAQAGKCS